MGGKKERERVVCWRASGSSLCPGKLVVGGVGGCEEFLIGMI